MFRTALVLVLSFAAPALADDFTLIVWNVESDFPVQSQEEDPHEGNDPTTIATELESLVENYDAQIVGLVEVKPSSFFGFRSAIQNGTNSNVDFVSSASGGDDSMMLVVDADRFDTVEAFELHRYEDHVGNANNLRTGELRSRSPLVVRLRDKESDNQEFYFVLNHLARGDDALRVSQARMLREWANFQTLPVITAGDMNFDYEFANDQGNPAMQAFMEGDVFEWLKPDPLIDSNWADIDPNVPQSGRRDRYPGSILDFVFAAKGARDWEAESDVVVREGDFPDTTRTSDHRPIVATFEVPD